MTALLSGGLRSNHEADADPDARNNRCGDGRWNVDTGYVIGRHAKEFPQNGGNRRAIWWLGPQWA